MRRTVKRKKDLKRMQLNGDLYSFDFKLGQYLYLKTDPIQQDRICTGISIRCNGSITYCLGLGSSESWHYAIEITNQKVW